MCFYFLLIKIIEKLIINYKNLMNSDNFVFKKIFNNFMKKF